MKWAREPTLIINLVSAVLTLVVTFGLKWLSAEQAALWVAVITGVFAAINAATVRPWAPPAFTGLVGVIAALLTGYGLHFSQEAIGALQFVIVSALALAGTRPQVTPKSDPVPTAPAPGQGVIR